MSELQEPGPGDEELLEEALTRGTSRLSGRDRVASYALAGGFVAAAAALAESASWHGRPSLVLTLSFVVAYAIASRVEFEFGTGFAVPSYLGFKDRANNRAAQADIRAAIPSMEAFYADTPTGTYVGSTPAALKLIDSGLAGAVVTSGQSTTAYCIGASVGGKAWSVNGPGATAWHGSTDCTGAVVVP